MSSRESILAALEFTSNKPVQFDMPVVDLLRLDDLTDSFMHQLKAAGGETVFMDDSDEKSIAGNFNGISTIVDTRIDSMNLPADLCAVDLLIVQGVLGVAENGAVWIEPTGRYPREMLTLSERIAIVLSKKRIVHTMHEAYESLNMGRVEYGIFMCGPSKTADIEQSLVMGAHGAMELKVFLY